MRTRTRKPKTSRAHGTGSTGSYYPATRITVQTDGGREKTSEPLYENIIPESCTILNESEYWRFSDIKNGRDDSTKDILRIPEVKELIQTTPDLAIVVQFGFMYAESNFEQLDDNVSFDLLSASRIKELLDEDWEDC